MKKIEYKEENGVAWVGFGFNNTKKMTVLCQETLTELQSLVEEIDTKAREKKISFLVFHSLVPSCFLAGADIKMIHGLKTVQEAKEGARVGQKIFNTIEDLPIPSVAFVDGVCMGGGLELALACNLIVASSNEKTSFALPEVKLGIIPGFGGTYRLPLKIGTPDALDLILSGKAVNAHKAKKLGLVEEVFPKEMLKERGLSFAQKYFKNSSSKEKNFKETLKHFALENPVSKRVIFQKAKESTLKATKGHYEAPLKILETMMSGLFLKRTAYLEKEASALAELALSSQSANLRHLYFLMEGQKKYTGPEVKEGGVLTLKKGGVIGAGTMGGGIAWLMASADMRPILKDITTQALELGLKQSSKNFKDQVKRKKISHDEMIRKQRSISPQLTLEGIEPADFIIEAVVENLDLKKNIFQELESLVSPSCILATNTSSLRLKDMLPVFKNPERFLGVHFFNPVSKMPLVEIVRHENSSPAVLKAVFDWCLKVKKTPLIVGDGPGFLVNRILIPYLNEAGFLLEEGVEIETLDRVAKNFGMPMGPCRLMDEIGLDVGEKVAKVLGQALGERGKSSEIFSKMAQKNLLGKKTNKGFFLYNNSSKKEELNPEATDLLFKDKGGNRKSLSSTEIEKRLILPMINEAARVLEEKIVYTAGEVDIGLIFGIGFPPFRGGLLRFADSLGIEKLLEDTKRLEQEVNPHRFAPAPLLRDLAQKKQKFYEFSSF